MTFTFAEFVRLELSAIAYQKLTQEHEEWKRRHLKTKEKARDEQETGSKKPDGGRRKKGAQRESRKHEARGQNTGS